MMKEAKTIAGARTGTETRTIGEVAEDIFAGLSLSGRSVGAKDEGDVVIRAIFITDLDGGRGTVKPEIERTVRVSALAKVRRYLVQSNDVLISCRGTVTKAAVFDGRPDPVAISANLIAVRPGPQLLPVYLLAYLQSPTGQAELVKLARGMFQQSFTVSDIASLTIPLPPLNVQKQIADLIGAANQSYELALAAAQQRRDIALAVASELMFANRKGEQND